MYLKSIELGHFRNFPSGSFEFSPGVNLFFGPNASGKTNVLEAIYVLSNLRSFRTHLLRESICWDSKEAYLRGIMSLDYGHEEHSPGTKTLAVKLKAASRELLINNKQCYSSKEYLQTLPSVAFSPDDLRLVKGAPSNRRYFLDKGTFYWYPPYWPLLAEYNRALKQRNSLLRKMQLSPVKNVNASLDIWDTQLHSLGSKIIIQRLKFIHNVQRVLQTIYTQWLHEEEQLEIRYLSSIGPVEQIVQNTVLESGDAATLRQIAELYAEAAARNQKREYHQATTLIGPHRDDLEIVFSGKKSLRSYGSQGQQRTAVLALRLAECHLYHERYSEFPLLLLDDVTSELDIQRNQGFIDCLQQGMQVFMTTTEKHDIVTSHSIPCTLFSIG